ncbi:MAG: Chemotaxis protein CheW [Rhodospirillales bacterium]|jgi:purine-binding chemotaxis protein CheW|nr:Chemotaxis protein CheW [Rhodospirillales bacterium]
MTNMSRANIQADSLSTLEDHKDFVSFTVAGQMFGISVLEVQDILVPTKIASVPLAKPEIRGSINLRGRIVTVIDVRSRLGLPKREPGTSGRQMGVTVETGHDLYTLLVDEVGDVISLKTSLLEPNPSTLDAVWRDFAAGVFRVDNRLMVVLDVQHMLEINAK